VSVISIAARLRPLRTLINRDPVSGGGNFGRTYDMSRDGKRLLMIKEGGADQSTTPPQLIVVQHFDEELKRLVPTK
jgi:hypothetical protein